MSRYTYEIHGAHFEHPNVPFIIHKSITHPEQDVTNWHANIEILYCVSGYGRVICNSDSYPFAQGDCFVINADTLHRIENDSQICFHCLIIDSDFLKSNGLELSKLHFTPHIRNQAASSGFLSVMDSFDALKKDYTHLNIAKLRYRVLGLVLDLIDMGYSTDSHLQPTSADQRIKTAIEYIKQNLHLNITLQQVANEVSISKYYLSREFKRFTGMTLISYINHLRCVEAMHRICQGMHVAEAAYYCGFENMSYFSRTYKKMIGILPSVTSQNAKQQDRVTD